MSDGYVYVIECEGLYKIGWSKWGPRSRASQMQVGNPFELKVIGAIPGSRENEAEWHEVFASQRVRGEWFALSQQDIAYVLNDASEVDQLPGDDDIA